MTGYPVRVVEVCGACVSVGDLYLAGFGQLDGFFWGISSVVGVVQVGGPSGVPNERSGSFVRDVVRSLIFFACPFRAALRRELVFFGGYGNFVVERAVRCCVFCVDVEL